MSEGEIEEVVGSGEVMHGLNGKSSSVSILGSE
jgi:hypothetical protein